MAISKQPSAALLAYRNHPLVSTISHYLRGERHLLFANTDNARGSGNNARPVTLTTAWRGHNTTRIILGSHRSCCYLLVGCRARCEALAWHAALIQSVPTQSRQIFVIDQLAISTAKDRWCDISTTNNVTRRCLLLRALLLLC